MPSFIQINTDGIRLLCRHLKMEGADPCSPLDQVGRHNPLSFMVPHYVREWAD